MTRICLPARSAPLLWRPLKIKKRTPGRVLQSVHAARFNEGRSLAFTAGQ